MKLFLISIKNIFETRWRSFILGMFIFFISFLMIFFNSFVSTMKANMEDQVINSLTGEIQIRSAQSEEDDMVSLKKTWGNINYLEGNQAAVIEKYFSSKMKQLTYTKRVRHNVMFVSNTGKLPAMIIGLDSSSSVYQKTFKLIDGKYLTPQKEHEVILSESQAEQLKVKVGDTLGVMAETKDGYPIDSVLTVAGIGNLQLSSAVAKFDYAYMDLKSAQELMDFQAGEVTDIIIYTKDRSKIDQTLNTLKTDLNKLGLTSKKIKISTWQTMGGIILGGINLYVITFYSFIFILMLVSCLLIINLVNMMSLERHQDIGTLKAIGFSRFRIIQIFMGEILLIVIGFCLIGTIVGSGLVLYFSKVGMPTGQILGKLIGEQFYMKFELQQIIPQIFIIFGFAFIASFYPTYKAASLNPVDTLKEI